MPGQVRTGRIQQWGVSVGGGGWLVYKSKYIQNWRVKLPSDLNKKLKTCPRLSHRKISSLNILHGCGSDSSDNTRNSNEGGKTTTVIMFQSYGNQFLEKDPWFEWARAKHFYSLWDLRDDIPFKKRWRGGVTVMRLNTSIAKVNVELWGQRVVLEKVFRKHGRINSALSFWLKKLSTTK
jgi:hypothetical protein